VRIALDAMGSDGAPAIEISGALAALDRLPEPVGLVLVGDEPTMRAELARQGWADTGSAQNGRVELIHASDRITSEDPPASAFRKKPDSSVSIGLRLQSEGVVDAFVSAGSTGAVMAASLFLLRPLEGVGRPALSTLVPTSNGPLLMLDAGANVDCRPEHLVQFAHLGHIYATHLMGIEAPRVGLLNIGEEERKGDELTIEAHRLLKTTDLHFIGNVEGSDIIRGACDVLVCDGFAGNVLLKFYESVAGFIVALLKERLDETGPDLSDIYRVLDYTEYGGAPLLGVNGVSIICHGKSPPRAIENALRVAARAVESSMVAHVTRHLAGTLEVNA